MGIINREINIQPYMSNPSVVGGESTGFLENLVATNNADASYRIGDESRTIAFDEIFAPLRQKVIDRSNVSEADRVNIFGASSRNQYAWADRHYPKYVNNTLDYIKQNPDLFPEDEFKGLTYDMLEGKAVEASRKKIEEQKEIASRQTFWGSVGEQVGGISGNWSTMDTFSLFVPEIKAVPFLYPIVSRMFQNVIINTGVEAAKYPEIKSWQEKVTGQEYTFEEFLQHEKDVAIGTIALTGAFEGATRIPYKKGYRWTKDTMVEGVEKLQDVYTNIYNKKATVTVGKEATLDAKALEEAKIEGKKEIDAVKAQIEIDDYTSKSNPLLDDAGDLEHIKRLNQVNEAIKTGNYSKLPKESPSAKPITDIHYFERGKVNIKSYDPANIKVDAETFQFKAGGDVEGVTERLQGVTQWDPISANTGVVYEKANGETFIVDGHQRLALAKRITAADPAQKIEFIAFPLREVDGVSVEEARVIAAMKNIREGTGTAIDAAKVLKTNPAMLGNLPPKSSLVTQADGLIRLSDDAFRLINNQVIPEHYGAIVGNVMTDPTEQIAAIEMLKRLDPSNVRQAEQIVRQMKDTGFVKSTQESLFGDEVISESLLLERAKILDAGSKLFKTDKQLFQSLTDNANKIEESGNILNRNNNATNEEIYAKAIEITKANANIKGPISESLTRLAREFKEGGGKGLQGYARQFADDVRRSVEDGSYERVPNGGLSSFDSIEKEAVTLNPEVKKDLSLFDEGIGSKGEVEQTKSLDVLNKEELNRDPEMENAIIHVDDIDANTGLPYSRTITMKEIMDDIAQDERAINTLKGCT
jgi:hypothetical protein